MTLEHISQVSFSVNDKWQNIKMLRSYLFIHHSWIYATTNRHRRLSYLWVLNRDNSYEMICCHVACSILRRLTSDQEILSHNLIRESTATILESQMDERHFSASFTKIGTLVVWIWFFETSQQEFSIFFSSAYPSGGCGRRGVIEEERKIFFLINKKWRQWRTK